MKNTGTGEDGLQHHIFEAVSDAAESVKKATQEAVEAITPVLQETRRQGVNGYESIEDAISATVSAGKTGTNYLKSNIKEIIENPKEAFERAKAKLSEANEIGKKGLRRAHEGALNAYERRNEHLDTALIHIHEAKDNVEFAVKNPAIVAKEVKQHGIELVKGTYQGTKGAFKDMSGHLQVGREDIKRFKEMIEKQSAEFALLKASDQRATSVNTADDINFLDSVLVGGDAFYSSLARQIPSDVLKAYALQYPGLADQDSFREHLLKLSDDGRKSFIAAIKGKLFEIKYVDYLNDGQLPDGYIATLSSTANQPGYDIEILGPDSHACELIQCKATDSVGYVKHALERYPDISVATTSEVHSELVMRGYQEHVIDGRIFNSTLKAHMQIGEDAADTDFGGPSVISMAILAFTSYSQEGLTAYEKSHNFGNRFGNYGVAFGSGALADYGFDAMLGDSAVGIPFISLVVASLTRTVIASGRRKIDQLKAMQDLVNTNELILNRMRP